MPDSNAIGPGDHVVYNDQHIRPVDAEILNLRKQVEALTLRVAQLEQDAQADKPKGFPDPGWFDEKHREDPVIHRISPYSE